MANLLDLIGLALRFVGLQIQDFHNPDLREDVMTPLDSFLESKLFEQATQSRKGDVRVGIALQYLLKHFFNSCHGARSLTQDLTG